MCIAITLSNAASDWMSSVSSYLVEMCLLILQTHQAVGRAIEVLEKTSGQTYPSKNKILQAYLSFEALCDHHYTYSCVSCGHHPITVVMDLHKKGVFSMPGKSMSLCQTLYFTIFLSIHHSIVCVTSYVQSADVGECIFYFFPSEQH